MACSDKKNPLQRSGTNQAQRVLNGRKQGYINIDERSMADWITFAGSFARYIKYVGADGSEADWSAFFNNDISAILGSVAIQDPDAYRNAIKERFLILKDENNRNNTTLLKETFGSLFSVLLTVSKALDDYIVALPETVQLRTVIQNIIPARLKASLARLLSYYKAASTQGIILQSDIPGWKVFNYTVIEGQVVIDGGLSGMWTSDDHPAWTDYYDSIVEDDSVFGSAVQLYDRLNHAVNHNLFTGIFDQYLLSFAKIVQDAEDQLAATLDDHDSHKPHYALFLAFLKLFRNSQDSINQLTGRHLDFYYQDVLGLAPQGPQPAHAHLIVELARQTDVYLLKRGTLFKAGKDSQGRDMQYELDRDTLFNKAKVGRLMSVYRGNANGADSYDIPYGPHINNNGRLFAAPVINSADGLGAEIKTDNKAWHPFVNKRFEEGKLVDIVMPEAVIGFAVASSQLYLTEGERDVFINFITEGTAPFAASLQADCYVTTEKGWLQIPDAAIKKSKTTKVVDCTSVYFSLKGDAPAIVNYDPEVHGGSFNCTTPLVKVLLKNSPDTDYTYDSLRNVTITDVEVMVRVGFTDKNTIKDGGLKNLLVSGDSGVFDPSKPFLPFGALPLTGASFVVGNEELFKKKNVNMQLRLEWANLPSAYQYIDYEPGADPNVAESAYVPDVRMQYLSSGLWTNMDIVTSPLINASTDPVVAFPKTAATLKPDAMVAYTDTYESYDVKSKKGFVRIQLKGDFGHKAYNDDQTQYLVKLAQKETNNPKPNEPYTPKLASVTLHYTASASSAVNKADKNAYNNRDVQFFHIYPFGETEQHAYTTGEVSVRFLPQFSHTDGASVQQHVGEFYIGVEALNPGQSVNILFQVLEGSTNPLLAKPASHVTWSYLSGEEWQVFDIMSVSDNTYQLLQSGIISFVIPEDATTSHYIMPSGYIWLRASVNEAAEAVCKLLSVDAQAAAATFKDNGNAADVYSLPLPAGTIAKLVEPMAVIKSVTQPYASFGSRQTETQEHFYTRVSERLRHKNRAITIWDYEHLVLEAFPEIHRVKCLNHTRYVDNDYNEMAPGYITIITLPNLVNRNDTDMLRPYTSQGTLTRIEAFLKKKMTCHAKLNVRHPLFEEVLLDFKLKLVDGLEFTYYSTLLQQEITEFLTPWAFGKTDDAQFGGKVIKSAIINFIEDRSYVDYITDVRMYHRINDVLTGGDLDTITASSARSILVSAQPSQHVIAQITTVTVVAGAESCPDSNAADQLPVR